MVKYIPPAPLRKTSMAENIVTKDVYTWGSILSIPPNEITFNNQERCGDENWVSARSMLENV